MTSDRAKSSEMQAMMERERESDRIAVTPTCPPTTVTASYCAENKQTAPINPGEPPRAP